MTALRDSSELLWPAVQETIASLGLAGEDAAAKKLAQRYAQVIDGLPDHAARGVPDQAWGLRWMGPLLLDALRELGATPLARNAVKPSGEPAAAPAGDLISQLTAAKAARRGR